jgi:guanylate kinase
MNQLKYAAEFRKVLANYHLSKAAQKTLKEVRLLLLVGPTSSGRNTLINELIKTGQYYHIVSDTTREKREKDGVSIEMDGREYWFRSEEEVLEGLKQGEYIEAAIIHNQQVSGCNFHELIAAHKARQIAIKDIEPGGAQALHDLKPDTLVVFSIAPSFDIWMERLHARGQMEPAELIRRMESAAKELETAFKCDYYRFIINDTIEGATAEVHRLATTGYYDPFKEKLARETTEKIYKQVLSYLSAQGKAR